MDLLVQQQNRIDGLLDELVICTETLADGTHSSFTSAWQALLERRSKVSRNVADAAQGSVLTRAQTAKLKSAIEVGAQMRFPIAARRENLRSQLSDLRDAQRAQRALKPFRRTAGRRLNVNG